MTTSSLSTAVRVKRQVFFPNYRVILLPHSYKPNALNSSVAFRVPRNLGKPQLLDYFTRVHGMKIAKLNTSILPSKVKRDQKTGQLWKTPSYKKVFVMLQEPEMITVPKGVKLPGAGGAAPAAAAPSN